MIKKKRQHKIMSVYESSLSQSCTSQCPRDLKMKKIYTLWKETKVCLRDLNLTEFFLALVPYSHSPSVILICKKDNVMKSRLGSSIPKKNLPLRFFFLSSKIIILIQGIKHYAKTCSKLKKMFLASNRVETASLCF